jgi:uncharacterized protein (DUF2267 family)
MTTMTYSSNDPLSDYYQYIRDAGKLRSLAHAQQWSRAILRTLGINLDRRTKQKLAKALPPELASELTRVFWLAHFRNSGMSQVEFLNQVSRRSGNTDPIFARYPTTAVFHQIKAIAGKDIADQVAKTFSPDVRQMWADA